jgi:aspartokinase-like uncharacterized kinase
MKEPLRVIKLGGSLLDWPELPSAFRTWLAAQPAAVNVLIVGGGAIVDGLRHLDQVHRLPPETSHWLAIDAMGLTARLARELLPEARLATGSELFYRPPGSLTIFDVQTFLRDDQSQADALPIGWDVTSDSIAAYVAQRFEASELVLLKSCPSPSGELSELARKGVVDPAFPRIAAGLNVRLVNLRGVS